MADIDYLRLVSDKESECSELFARMDKDKDLCVLKEFTLVDKDDREAPSVENITMNDAKIFFDKVCGNLIAAQQQVVVEGNKSSDKETTFVENFIRDFGAVVDRGLLNRSKADLRTHLIHQQAGRGRMAARICLHVKNGQLVPGVVPLDTRYIVYEPGYEKNKWVALKTRRSINWIREEYPEYTAEAPAEATVTGIWDDEYERVFVERDMIRKKKHPYGEPPFVIQLAPVGLFFQDSDSMAQDGESILAPNRSLYEAKNKLASILMTLTVMSFYAPLQKEVENVATAKKPDVPPYGKKIVVPIEKGTRGYFSMPINDVNNAAKWLYQMIESALEKGSLPAVSYGNLTFPLSAIAITSLTEAENSVYLPQLQGLALFYQRYYRMVIDQYIKLGLNSELGRQGFLQPYPYQQLDKDYSINFKFSSTSPKQSIANYSVSNAAKADGISRDTRWRTILQLENPTDEDEKHWSELADDMVPTLRLYKMAKAKIEQGEEIEAQLIADQLGLTIDQLTTGKLNGKPTEAPPRQVGAEPIIPLLPTEGQTGGRITPSKEATILKTDQGSQE